MDTDKSTRGKKSEAVDLHTFHVYFGTVGANGKLKRHSTRSIVIVESETMSADPFL